VMSETVKTPPPRRTIAVTVAGVLLLMLPAAAFAFMAAIFLFDRLDGRRGSIDFTSVGINFALAGCFGYAGLATIRRWRGWRIWAGTASWSMIVIIVLGLFDAARSDPNWAVTVAARIIVVALAVFVLVAKRRERRPNIGAVFE
jgi:hypothetical protein